MSYKSPYKEDRLQISDDTQLREIREFVHDRAKDPWEFQACRVWNFNNHELNQEQFMIQKNEFKNGEYLIPYQISGVWAVMFALLPERIRNAEILTWSGKLNRYVPFDSIYNRMDPNSRENLQNELQEWCREEL